jgi:hypothetical protein
MAWTDPESYTLDQLVGVTELHKIRDNMRELWHELAYVEFVGDVTAVGLAETVPADIVSSGTQTYVANPIVVEFGCPGMLFNGAGGVNSWTPGFMLKRLTPTAASHTYKARLWETSGTATVASGAGGAGAKMPGYIRVMQKGGP